MNEDDDDDEDEDRVSKVADIISSRGKLIHGVK
jgi:hypothetical protein